MKVLVLGGTGAIGWHLIQLLSNEGIETVVTSRTAHTSENKIQYIQGNAHDIKFLHSILEEKWDSIVDFMIYSTSSFRERVDLLLNSTSQYIYLSSARVYADSEFPITENSSRLLEISQDKEFLATEEYSLEKARQEDILSKSGKKNWTIIRPYITYSEDRLQLGVLEKEEWLYRALNGKTIVFSKDINLKVTTLTYGLDVSKGIKSVIGVPEALGETFHITTQECKKWHEILDIYITVLEKHMGYSPKVLLQDLSEFLRCKPNKYQVEYDRLYNRSFDSSKIINHMGAECFVELEAGLKSCLNEFLKNPQFKQINWKMMGTMDRLTNEKTPLSEITGIKNVIDYIINRYF